MANTKDYQNGKIYTIRNNIDEEVYVGSTCQPLSKRMAVHRSNTKIKEAQSRNIYKHMNNLGIENFYIELYESYPCNTCEELTKREGQIIREIGTLNINVAGQTKQEYSEANRDKILEHHKQYYQNNKDKAKAYYQNNKDKILQRMCKSYTCGCGRTIRQQEKNRHCKSKVHQDYLSSQSTTDTSTDDNQ